MAIQRLLALRSGKMQEYVANDVSGGAGDAGHIVALNARGQIDTTMLPLSTGAGVVPPGSASSFTFVQPTPDSVWTIPHNLGRYPSVVVVDSSGGEVEGEVRYVSINQIVLTFAGAFSGIAACN